MAASQTKSAATIKFFRPSNDSSTDSDSDSSNEDHVTQNNNGVSLHTRVPSTAVPDIMDERNGNPFEDGFESDDSDFKGRDREESIYDSHTSSGLDDLSRSTRQRTDSDSNYLHEEEIVQDEPLVLDMMEDHFGLPEDLSRLKDVNYEIDKIKEQIYRTSDDKMRKRQLIEKLVSLRLRKSELETTDDGSNTSQARTIYGHEFKLKESTAETERFCEVCCAVVWGVIHTWYTCTFCHICCHDKCLNSLKRMCALKKLSEPPTYIMSICRDRGLAVQNYKCAECQTPISHTIGAVEPRQCDYTGAYYCSSCHWNDEVVIPARVVQNWDFLPRKVCRASKQYLRLLYHKPILCIEMSNKSLLNYVEELREMKKLRQEILLMKAYFLSCQAAMQSKLLLLLENRQHFVENADCYTMHDLVELVNERLLPITVNIHASFASHIKVDCATCRGKGYFCEICQKSEIVFPFDNICVLCNECSNVFHKYCFAKVDQNCPKCERKKRRQIENERKAGLLRQIEEANSA